MTQHSVVWPAEWARQDAVMLTWPHRNTDWADILQAAEDNFRQLLVRIARHEPVIVACDPAADRAAIETLAHNLPHPVYLYTVPSNDTWARDHGPVTVLRDGRPVLLDFTFNAWGGKFDATLDNEITRNLHQQGAFGRTPVESLPFVLEGGGIESDGEGTLLTTSMCLLTPTRNPDFTREDIEHYLGEKLGVDRVLWLDHGYLEGDDTDSHVDTLARFCNPDTIAYVQCTDPDDPHYDALRAMEAQLQSFTRRDGNPYTLIPLPMPQACYSEDGHRLPATYANFLIINDAVLVPTYGVPEDRVALERLAEAFPGRAIEAVNCRTLIEQHGSLHCVTMQIPEGVLS
ncbi:agmatine deiminase family protein [Hahella sp. SMD15-11]|uniref:Agmatine deiminase family protein n=1 Tax=Thermohahella caldifontis TaxID=3142973 RepID=A0AB39UX63_9GAMM